MLGLISTILFLGAGLTIALAAKCRYLHQVFVVLLVSTAALIIACGYVLSWQHQIDSLFGWVACSGIALLVSLVLSKLTKTDLRGSLTDYYLMSRIQWKKLNRVFGKRNSSPKSKSPFLVRNCRTFGIVFAVTQVAQLLVIFLFPPSHHDSFSYILPRMAHYIQQGDLDYFESNYVALTVHCKNAAVLHIYTYLVMFKSASLVQLVSFVSSILATFCVFGIALSIWKNNIAAMFSAFVFAMLTNNLMIAVTPQLDMPITGFIAASVFCLLTFVDEKKYRWLVFSSTSTAIAFGIKTSALLLIPSLAIIAAVGFWHVAAKAGWQKSVSAFAVALVAFVVAAIIFMLPAGYLDNHNRYEHFMGPEDWRSNHVLQNVTLHERLRIGTANASRYAIHFVSVDGFPGDGKILQRLIRKPLTATFTALGIKVNSTEQVRQPFRAEFFSHAHEDVSFAGPAAYLLVLPAICIVLLRFRSNPIAVALVVAGITYFFAQSYSSMYDPWRGRSFVNLGIFMAPLLGCLCLTRTGTKLDSPTKKGEYVWMGIATVVLFTAINASMFRSTSPAKYLFRPMDRIELLCRCNKRYTERIKRYEELVPPGSTVVLEKGVGHCFQFPLYGETLNRKVVFSEDEATNETIDFRVFSSKRQKPQPSDIALDTGEEPDRFGQLYLRKLNPTDVAHQKQSVTR